LIDIHSHVLYGLDDGPRTFEDSLAMIRMAAAHGTTALVATPHASPDYRFQPETIARRMEELRGALRRLARTAEPDSAESGALELYSGCDFHLSYDNIEDALVNPTKYTINRKNYLLVEFSDLLIFKNTSEIFARLAGAGMTPIITHPERNGLLRMRLEEIAGWVESGVCVQVTAQSLTGEFGQRARGFSQRLLDRGLVHFIASDGHDCVHRPPCMDLARAWLAEHYSDEVSETLCTTNPRAAVTGVPLKKVSVEVAHPSRKWYQFWR
jgi:protein-tyrosine phosphatase